MKKIYIVTAGTYSGYHIEKVFTDPEKARLYQMLHFPYDGDVESYDVDVVDILSNTKMLRIQYNVNYNSIYSMKLTEKYEDDVVEDDINVMFSFTQSIGDDRLYKNIIRHGMNSKKLLAIAADRFAQWLYENGKSKEQVIQENRERLDKRHKNHGPFLFVSTSSDTIKPDGAIKIVDERVTNILRTRVVEGKQLPTVEELGKIYTVELEKEKEKQP